MQVSGLSEKTNMRSSSGWIFALCLLCASGAQAASTSAPVQVTATVVTNCQITVSDLAFGSYDPLGSNATQQLDGAAAVRVLCTRSASASIAIDAGRSGSRTLQPVNAGAQQVAYQLYRDSNRTRAWSTESDNVRLVSNSAREPQQFTVYARIPAGQQIPSGRYTDVVRATVYF